MAQAPTPLSTTWSQHVSPGKRLPMPGPVYGPYPLRDAPEFASSSLMAWMAAWLRSPPPPGRAAADQLVKLVREHSPHWAGLTASQFETELSLLKARLAVQGFDPALTGQAMAAVASVVQRQLGWSLHDVQLKAAWWMLGGRLIEMATGEGKTITVVLAAATAALAGVPVHVMTANDYLARRDAQQWSALYAALGLQTACVVSASEPPERQRAYQNDIVYATAKEFAFDHLRDRVARSQGREADQVLRGLCMAIIDEADSILIDEACTPLVLSQAVNSADAEQRHRLAIYLARKLKAGRDFVYEPDRPLRLRHEGAQRLAQAAAAMPGPWRLKRFREEQVGLALTALWALKRDVHYLVRDDEVHIIDGTTGRLAIGRAWSRGLHQMVCIKEQVRLSPETQTLLQTTYQEFFPRYHRVCGLSGTLWEERREFLAIYGVPVIRVPLRLPSQRRDLGLLLFEDDASKWQAVVRHALQEAERGRAVLVGVDSVSDSEKLSALLAGAGVPHRVLNASHDEQAGEAERSIIDVAGLPGAITVATHMAGRGTDIQPHADVLARGGLHVINTHLNASARIDRQLYGRAGRQGQPGSYQWMLCWQDETLTPLTRHATLTELVKAACRGSEQPVPGAVRWVFGVLQFWAGRQTARQRWSLLQLQQAMRRQTAWAGRDDWV